MNKFYFSVEGSAKKFLLAQTEWSPKNTEDLEELLVEAGEEYATFYEFVSSSCDEMTISIYMNDTVEPIVSGNVGFDTDVVVTSCFVS